LKKILFLIIAIATLSGIKPIWAQVLLPVPDSLRVVNFRLTNEKTGEPVGLAHVLNITQKKGCISDLMGYFKIPYRIGDSLRITALGYHQKYILNWGQFSKDTIFYSIKLTPKVYEIEEVRISRFTTYDRFLREFAHLDLKKDKEEQQNERIRLYFYGIVKGLALLSLPGQTMGVTFGKDWYQKQNEKVDAAIEKERLKRKAENKFNLGVVEKLTGLKGEELQRFFDYLSFDQSYVLKATDYELRERILELYEQYKKALPNDKTSHD